LTLTSGEQILIDNHQKKHSFHLTVENLGADNNSPGSLVFFRDINTQKLNERKLQDGIEFRARLLAFLAHDLTGLLENQAVLSLSLQSKVNVEQYPEVSLLTSSALASQELVENIMAWIQNQVIGFQPIVRPFEWNLLLKEALEQIEGRLKVSDIRLNFQSQASQLFGEGDSEMLAAVFRNLVSNAIRATPRGRSLHIELRADQSHAFVSVRDEGCGIEPAKLDNILAASKEFLLGGVPDAEGSGIGLMIARQFIALHGGTFEMKSNLGFGTEVSFSVPL
jgi:signal transduction histidine kinase